jgi:hypothetical protein
MVILGPWGWVKRFSSFVVSNMAQDGAGLGREISVDHPAKLSGVVHLCTGSA